MLLLSGVRTCVVCEIENVKMGLCVNYDNGRRREEGDTLEMEYFRVYVIEDY